MSGDSARRSPTVEPERTPHVGVAERGRSVHRPPNMATVQGEVMSRHDS